MATFTSSLPDDLLERLTKEAKKLSLPKNKLLENALRLYLEHLKRVEYIQSFKRAAGDEDSLALAEEGMADYFKQLEEHEAR
ncbi:ribbon-helix-helix protein, CopG family [Algoriphagus kandeliae]|uniref:Ribbon-helix-helix protein, CopG family n=1 Tax=Algoriphagus kandeliae TaxID=2562278 RepID=A0A4Y9QUR3_9BACT|nr:ribbon-helix-helix protein, CopG family [Algoriphagus kandeliae]TFV96249.1 ribbon-helix-helix protein, CopG family [Algoriphagus kandeliae]